VATVFIFINRKSNLNTQALSDFSSAIIFPRKASGGWLFKTLLLLSRLKLGFCAGKASKPAKEATSDGVEEEEEKEEEWPQGFRKHFQKLFLNFFS
jgi:hypothetical protein